MMYEGEEFIFDSAIEVREFFEGLAAHVSPREKVESNRRMEEHFALDWLNDETISDIGLSAIKPIALLTIPAVGRPTRCSVKPYVVCEEGMISLEEVELARKGSGMVPTLSQISETCSEIRKSWGSGLNSTMANGEWSTGVDGPGIRECVHSRGSRSSGYDW